MRIAPLLIFLLAGCSSPGWVDGVVREADFIVSDVDPVARRGQDDGLVIVVAETIDDQLRVLSIQLRPGFEKLESPIELGRAGGEKSWATASWGKEKRIDRGDGAIIVTSTENNVESSKYGLLWLDLDGESLSGEIRVEMEKGGFLEGAFSVAEIQ